MTAEGNYWWDINYTWLYACFWIRIFQINSFVFSNGEKKIIGAHGRHITANIWNPSALRQDGFKQVLQNCEFLKVGASQCWLNNTFCLIKFTRKIVTSWISWRAEKGGWFKTYGTMFGEMNISSSITASHFCFNLPGWIDQELRPWKRCFFFFNHVKNPTFSGWNLWKPSSGCVNPNVPVWWFPKIGVPPNHHLF